MTDLVPCSWSGRTAPIQVRSGSKREYNVLALSPSFILSFMINFAS